MRNKMTIKKAVKRKVVKRKAPAKPKVDWKKATDFIGVRWNVKAVPMTSGIYNKFRGFTSPAADEDPKRPGYVVRYPGSAQYVSWTPKEIFEVSYQRMDKMDFSRALFMLKSGVRIARKGWNGKKMWLTLVPATPDTTIKRGTPYAKAGLKRVIIDAHIDMMTAKGTMQPGWLASQADILAEDWTVVV